MSLAALCRNSSKSLKSRRIDLRKTVDFLTSPDLAASSEFSRLVVGEVLDASCCSLSVASAWRSTR